MVAAWALLIGCARDPELDSGPVFEVVGCSPEDGADDGFEAVVPELRFSDAADPATCNADTLRLDAVDGAGRVLASVAVEPVFAAGDEKVQLTHAVGLARGYTYALSVAAAASPSDIGCTSASGLDIAPFLAEFTVP